MDFIKTADFRDIDVRGTTVRGNPALEVTFNNVPDMKAFFVADPGDEYWAPQIIFIHEKGTTQTLDEYVDGGQSVYGSDNVVRHPDGTFHWEGILVDGVTRGGQEYMTEIVAGGADEAWETGHDPLAYTAEATFSQQVILDVVVATEEWRAFFAEAERVSSTDPADSAPADSVTVERRVLLRAIASEYMVEHTKDLRVTMEDADAFARRVVDGIPKYVKVIQEEDNA